jgi:hypothetical protein
VRVSISVGALVVVGTQIDLAEVARAISGLDGRWTVAAFGVVYAAIAVSALKWQILLGARATRWSRRGCLATTSWVCSSTTSCPRRWVRRESRGTPVTTSMTRPRQRLRSSPSDSSPALALGVTATLGCP